MNLHRVGTSAQRLSSAVALWCQSAAIPCGILLALMCWSGLAFAARAIATDQGSLTGLAVAGETEYRGIPYAAPPVGSLRWLPPQPPARFNGLFQATQFGNRCTQLENGAGSPVVGSEDCLYLNVYVPDLEPPEDGFPVMVWIHGGGLTSGAGSDYDPTPLVEQGGVVVVTINYRLGYLGFFAQSALDSEGHPAGNYGLMDQQFALSWVRRNIGAFGGDRDRVTIFGESAGGLSVYSNLASPTAAGLFQRAISESGAYVSFAGHFPFADYLVGIVPLAVAESTGALGFGFVPAGNDVAGSLGCGNQQQADCLRSLTAVTIVDVEPPGVFPFVDGTVLTRPPGVAISGGNFNRAQVISGSNRDEYRLFVAFQELASGPLTDAEYPAAVAAFVFPPNPAFATELATNVYPLSNYTGQPPGFQRAPLALGALGTDVVFACPARNADLLLSKYVPTYAYEFSDETAPSLLPPLSFPLGDAHFIEVQYLFNFGAPFDSDQQQLSDTMIGYWTQFAKSGNPNGRGEEGNQQNADEEGAPHWPSYNKTAKFLSLVAPVPTRQSDASFDADHKCASFWNTF